VRFEVRDFCLAPPIVLIESVGSVALIREKKIATRLQHLRTKFDFFFVFHVCLNVLPRIFEENCTTALPNFRLPVFPRTFCGISCEVLNIFHDSRIRGAFSAEKMSVTFSFD
jgi:hypothetical protein